MQPSPSQQRVLDTLQNTRSSVLLTGVAGSGKSSLLNLWNPGRRAITVAPTGVAALNVGGSTIHRAFGFHPRTPLHRAVPSLRVKTLLHAVDTLVIDEVSMVRADLFAAMDRILRMVKSTPDTPFGGVRLVMTGDFWQLPPVVRPEEADALLRNHGSAEGWVFLSPAFRALAPEVFFLQESFRQAGAADFAGLLNAVRDGDPAAADAINDLSTPAPAEAPRLCARRAQVGDYNAAGLRALGASVQTFDADVSGDVSRLPRELREPLRLAEGCRVMCTRNGAGYVNGSVGTLEAFDGPAVTWKGEATTGLQVRLDNGERVGVPRAEAEAVEYRANHRGEVEAVVTAVARQYPVQLGYAWTIHKSQGQTLDRALIDMRPGAFAHGQTYVALSRLRSPEGLHLAAPLRGEDILVDPAVPTFFAAVGQ